MSKVISAHEAAQLIRNGDTVSMSGFANGMCFPETLCQAVEDVFLETGSPRDLTLFFASGNGDSGKSNFGLDHFAFPGMVRTVIGGHVGLAKKLSGLINENKIAAYNLPQGVVVNLYRAIAGGRVGFLTHVGLGTFADPRVDGAKMNTAAKEDIVEFLTVGGQEQLLYKSRPIHVAFIRGTTADEFGNISIEKEAIKLETLPLAQAAKNSGGIVIAQVERLAERGSLNPMQVQVPGIMVDYVVVDPDQKQTLLSRYNPHFSGEIRACGNTLSGNRMEMNLRKIIAKRCAMELKKDAIVNLGIGVPDGVSAVALEEGISDLVNMTIEAGPIGGVPAGGLELGAASNADAIISQPDMFDYYDGGGLDLAFLGLAQADRNGNINVSKFAGRMVGCGGFVDITQNAKKVVFCGTFTSGKTNYEIRDRELHILEDGHHMKFVKDVEQITFSGEYAVKTGREILYVTERAVFRLTDKGMELMEIAPGVDLQKDILDRMEFRPIIPETLRRMDAAIFEDSPMGLLSRFE